MDKERVVLNIIKEIGDPLMSHIINRSGFSKQEANDIVSALMKKGLVRMKEDPYDHDWAYVLTSSGKTLFKLD